MMNLTAVIRCKADSVDTVLHALVAVGDYAKVHEPGTLGYRVIRSTDDPTVLITQERFKNRDALNAHNEGVGSKTFFAAAEGLLEHVDVYIGEEVFDLGQTPRA